MAQRARYLLTWPLANLRHSPWTSCAAVTAVAAAAYVATTLLGFVQGYQAAVAEDVDRLGYDLLITAKGCPYEAATLMLRGGVGLQYMPASVVSQLRSDADVSATFPMLIHPTRTPGNDTAMTLIKGVDIGWRDALDLQLKEGAWFEETDAGLRGDGVVLGYEAAELEQRHAGDPYLLHGGSGDAFTKTTVLGVLERTGTQVDGTVILPIATVQATYDLPGKLTGVGVQVRSSDPLAVERLRDTYNQEPALQVVSLSRVEDALRGAMDSMRDVASILALALALLAGLVLLLATLLRTLSEHRRLYTLRVIGVPAWFMGTAAVLESVLLALCGALLGMGLATWTGGWASGVLVDYLPYAPDGNLIALPLELGLSILGLALALAVAATLPPLARVLWLSDLQSLREG